MRRLLGSILVVVCAGLVAAAQEKTGPFDPLAYARSKPRVWNREASVPPQCYTKTEGGANPCWACHVDSEPPNLREDWDLQEDYAFSRYGLENRWTNLFLDRRPAIETIPDDQILGWIRANNYAPLKDAIARRKDYAGYRPDLDFERGFDAAGFANDGSGWRALRYKPFPGVFWPTNGAADDVFIRLPLPFRQNAEGKLSRTIYRENLAILERAIATAPGQEFAQIPSHYLGGAAHVAVRRHLHPAGTEYLHSVRYVDPDAPDLRSVRMRELRYSRKRSDQDDWRMTRAYEQEAEERDQGIVPRYRGDAEVGLMNAFDWQLQGFIEDEKGRLRLQTREEQRVCMGCHGSLGVTVDSTFTLPRKLAGEEGWRLQDLRGQKDLPLAGHDDPEILTWMRRAQGGDEFRSNKEMRRRFFPKGRLDEKALQRAAPGGDRDLTWLLAPSRRRALDLAKAYLLVVREQSFVKGRDPVLTPVTNVHRKIETNSTGLREAKAVHRDGRLWLAQ